MPKIILKQEDINRAKKCEAGWHMFRLESVEEKPSKDKQSINYVCWFECIGPQGDASIERYSQARGNSKAIGMLFIPLVSAINDIPIDEVKPDEIDTDMLVGKTCWANVVESLYEGKIKREIEGEFAPNSRPPF